VQASTCDTSLISGATQAVDATEPPDASHFQLRVPIIEYHRIVPFKVAGSSMPALIMDPRLFDAQMAAAQQAGWRTMTLAALADDLAAGIVPGPKSFVITIDDGWRDGYDYAFPILQKYGFVATFFVIAGRIGDPSFLNPGQMQSLIAAGNEIGNHSVHHVRMTAYRSVAAMVAEIDSAEATIASATGRWPETLAYPLGKWDSRVVSAVATCSAIHLAVVEGHGANEVWSTRFEVGRIEVPNDRQPADLLADLARHAH